MNSHVGSWVSRKKWILAAAGLPVLIAAWWAFRPEKLWINQKVNEPALFASASDPQPLYTGRLEGGSSGYLVVPRNPLVQKHIAAAVVGHGFAVPLSFHGSQLLGTKSAKVKGPSGLA